MSNNPQIEKQVRQVLGLLLKIDPKEVIIVERFKRGMSNFTYHVKALEQEYVVRIPGYLAELFVDFYKEQDVLIHLEPVFNLPHVVFLDPDHGYKVSRYLPGISLADLPDFQEYLPKIARELKKLHSLKIDLPKYDIFNRLSLYESYNEEIDPRYIVLKEEVRIIYQEKYAHLPLVVSHGDLQRSNLLLSEGEIVFLDYEFSGLNDPYYDLASFGNISFTDTIPLLDAYLGRLHTKAELQHLIINRVLQCLQWHQVALKKAELYPNNELGMDFKTISHHYLETAYELYRLYLK